MAEAAIAAGTRKRAADITLGIARVAHLAAAERDTKMASALRELADLSAEKAADKLAQLGFRRMSHMTVRRARQRLGISGPAPGKAARKAEPRRRRVAQKAREEIAAIE